MSVTDTQRVPSTASSAGRPALEVRHLSTSFVTDHGPLTAVNDVSFTVGRGRVLAVIGESGSGKSALLRSIIGIQPASASVSGEVWLDGRDLFALGKAERAASRGREVSMVFQDPLTALDPVFTIERQLVETLRRHLDLSARQARDRAVELLQLVQIPSPAERVKAYPFELSGGMRQRVVIAMALACNPKVLLADEPTTALDVTVQARILDLIRSVQRETDIGVVIVTHDLAVAAEVADDVAVMYAGRFVESGPARDVLLDPAHPYTAGLLEANVRPGQRDRPRAIPGAPPSLARLPPGCAFAPRCDHATVECWAGPPELVEVGPGRATRCPVLAAHRRSAAVSPASPVTTDASPKESPHVP